MWSYNIEEIDLNRDSRRIILNILNLGTKAATDWLFLNYSKDQIKKTVEEFGAKGELSPKSLNYWQVVLGIGDSRLLKTRF